MFASVEEGLQVYKEILRNFLRQCREINEAEKQSRQEDGKGFRGSVDWTPDNWRWKETEQARMRGMEEALGLSRGEISDIVFEVNESLAEQGEK